MGHMNTSINHAPDVKARLIQTQPTQHQHIPHLHLNWGEQTRGKAGAKLVEWYQIHKKHGFHVFDAIPFTLFQMLL